MPTVSEFWDGRAQNYDAQVGTHYAEAYEKTAAHFKKYLKPTDTVLDFACGTGIVTCAVAPVRYSPCARSTYPVKWCAARRKRSRNRARRM